ncbi:hypothetical protein [Salmonella phage vB_SpuS_Sp4]|nr:hypothetical protein [Salmonella phage vB_SpuS_Sp4]
MTRGNNVWRVNLAGGGVRQGRDTYFDVFPISVTLVVSPLGRQAFLSFMEKVDGGASSFWMKHDLGQGIEDYQVTLTSYVERVHRRREELGNNFHGHSREITIPGSRQRLS